MRVDLKVHRRNTLWVQLDKKRGSDLSGAEMLWGRNTLWVQLDKKSVKRLVRGFNKRSRNTLWVQLDKKTGKESYLQEYDAVAILYECN